MDQQQHSWSKNDDVVPRLTTFTLDVIKQQNKLFQVFQSGPIWFDSIQFRFNAYTSYEHTMHFGLIISLEADLCINTFDAEKSFDMTDRTLWQIFRSLARSYYKFIVCKRI